MNEPEISAEIAESAFDALNAQLRANTEASFTSSNDEGGIPSHVHSRAASSASSSESDADYLKGREQHQQVAKSPPRYFAYDPLELRMSAEREQFANDVLARLNEWAREKPERLLRKYVRRGKRAYANIQSVSLSEAAFLRANTAVSYSRKTGSMLAGLAIDYPRNAQSDMDLVLTSTGSNLTVPYADLYMKPLFTIVKTDTGACKGWIHGDDVSQI